ncbi:MAG TPA: (2Fe-2S)-binding protein [Caulifigura sp.]|jgi:aerobic-type carbon monoxide dehydrogenase small subunit (CoxS/CutS family)|nr:(2Fe-2S)-binding protein [Caulifigura sp.]
MDRDLSFTVNGQKRQVRSPEARPLLDVLREELKLTGTKFGCGQGECGACTVLIDGQPIRSCITPAGDANGKAIRTIEGLANGDKLHPVQQAFLDQQAMQCGYCVPGQIMTAVALCESRRGAPQEEVIAAMRGNICRCCNYPKILAAVEQAVRA